MERELRLYYFLSFLPLAFIHSSSNGIPWQPTAIPASSSDAMNRMSCLMLLEAWLVMSATLSPAVISGILGEACATDADCDDADLCTRDVCMGGTCDHIRFPCDDGFDCTLDACEPSSGCISIPQDEYCNDGNPCTLDSCLGFVGCVHDSLCDDGDPCTIDTCTAQGVPCELVCSNAACQQKGGNTVTCECIKDCNGRSCKYVGGVNPCRVNGVCCCAAETGSGASGPRYMDNCVDCPMTCKGASRVCTGNYYELGGGALANLCEQDVTAPPSPPPPPPPPTP
eukprot:jgi/Mesvir1/13715/Mv22181-RA.1